MVRTAIADEVGGKPGRETHFRFRTPIYVATPLHTDVDVLLANYAVAAPFLVFFLRLSFPFHCGQGLSADDDHRTQRADMFLCGC